MKEILDVTVVLPIKSSLPRDFDEYFGRAIQSLQNQKTGFKELLIVASQEEQLNNYLNEFDFGDLPNRIIKWDGESNFANQVNFGIENSSSEWITVFEFDDEYSAIWFDNVKKYATYYPSVQSFMPVVVDVDEKGVFAGFTNEALTNETLQDYQNFQTAGSVIKKSVIEDFGGFKGSIKLTFVYEFLLRLTHNNVKIMTVPRVGYQHLNFREDSLFWLYKNDDTNKLSEDEAKFWLETAKKEFFFKNKRDVTYTEA